MSPNLHVSACVRRSTMAQCFVLAVFHFTIAAAPQDEGCPQTSLKGRVSIVYTRGCSLDIDVRILWQPDAMIEGTLQQPKPQGMTLSTLVEHWLYLIRHLSPSTEQCLHLLPKPVRRQRHEAATIFRSPLCPRASTPSRINDASCWDGMSYKRVAVLYIRASLASNCNRSSVWHRHRV